MEEQKNVEKPRSKSVNLTLKNQFKMVGRMLNYGTYDVNDEYS